MPALQPIPAVLPALPLGVKEDAAATRWDKHFMSSPVKAKGRGGRHIGFAFRSHDQVLCPPHRRVRNPGAPKRLGKISKQACWSLFRPCPLASNPGSRPRVGQRPSPEQSLSAYLPPP